MDAFLGKITQHAMNYAIRSGIGITASFAISQTARLLKTVDDNGDHQELQSLQQRLDSKIRIISPAIDMVELISARGNTTLETAVTLTKALRWDIQSLGVRLERAASAEEQSRKKSNGAKSRTTHQFEIRQIVLEIRKLLTRIEDAVPLLNLAITTSGARLSTILPTSVSPSRLLQASTFLTAGDTQYSMNPRETVQVGPAFTLSLYMLFAGHSYRFQENAEGMRETTWKEVIHKGRVKLMRSPLRSSISTYEESSIHPTLKSVEDNGMEPPVMSAIEGANEFSYRLEIIEDLDDDRLHTFEADEHQPGPYGDIRLAGIRELLPIYQISKIFYADTGKILNIGNQGEANNPVLLLKRDVNALPPRRMMQDNNEDFGYLEPFEEGGPPTGDEQDPQDDIDHQIQRESSVQLPEDQYPAEQAHRVPESDAWRFPPNLDTEWLALEVYTEPEDLDSEDGLDVTDESACTSDRPSSSGLERTDKNLAEDMTKLNLDQQPMSPKPSQQVTSTNDFSRPILQNASPFGPIRSSLSLLEMLIRLTALQQFQQASHLSIPDELLTFFLEESSTTGAGGDGDERRRTRRDARQKVGFDPYDESPIKRHGEDYQYQNQSQIHEQHNYEEYSRGGTPYDEYGRSVGSPGWDNERETTRRGTTPQQRYPLPRSQRWQNDGTPEQHWLKTRESSGPQSRPSPSPSSPMSSYRPVAKNPRPLDRVQQKQRGVASSPLGRGLSVDMDSSLGTSPGSPTLVGKVDGGH